MKQQIALGALIVIFGAAALLYPVIDHMTQPPTPTPDALRRAAIAEQTATAEARRRATPTPIPLTTIPGARGEEAINCRLLPGETWTPIKYLAAADGKLYVMARTAGGCHGWMVDPN